MPVAAATLTFKGSNRSRSHIRIRLICHSLLIKIAARPAAAAAAGAAAATLIGSSNCAIISEIVQDDLLLL